MLPKSQQLFHNIILLLASLVVTGMSFTSLLTHPGNVMTELGADGGKNIFTYLYHSLYGNGIWFQGMNYPYGEHIVYTDAQPLLSVPLSFLHPSMAVALSIMGWAICASSALAFIFTYKTVKMYTALPWLSLVFAALITTLSPQCLRISGHYALSYFCVLPMLFYWTASYYHSQKMKYAGYIAILGVLSIFMHPYYGAVILVWGGIYSMGYLLASKKPFSERCLHIGLLLAATVSGFIVFGIFMKITDPFTDRPSTPYGTLQNCAKLQNIITSPYSPIWEPLLNKFGVHNSGEGFCYPGLMALLMLPAMLLISQHNRPLASPATRSAISFPPLFLLIAGLSLLLAMGIPFIWNMEWLLDYASVFRQFRTLGRFSWIFYHIVTVYGAITAIALYDGLREKGRMQTAGAFLAIVLCVWAAEGWSFSNRQRQAIANGVENYRQFTSLGTDNWASFLQKRGYQKDRFQAILVLPFFQTGSEKLWVCSDENASAWAVAVGIKAGIQLQLPMVDAMLSRSSWEKVFTQVKIAGGPYTEKPMLHDLKDKRPFLLLQSVHTPLDRNQQYLVDHSVYIGDLPDCKAYACYPSQVLAADSLARRLAIDQINRSVRHDTCIDCADAFIWKQWGDIANLTAPHSLTYRKGMSPILLDETVHPTSDIPCEFSCWFEVPNNNYRSPDCIINIYSGDGRLLSTVQSYTKESTDNGKGLRNGAFFTLPYQAREIVVKVQDIEHKNFLSVSSLMIMPANALRGRLQFSNVYMINNHFFPDIQKGCK